MRDLIPRGDADRHDLLRDARRTDEFVDTLFICAVDQTLRPCPVIAKDIFCTVCRENVGIIRHPLLDPRERPLRCLHAKIFPNRLANERFLIVL